MPLDVKQLFLKLLLWFFTSLLLFLALEFALRIFWTPPVEDRQQFFLEHDSLYGWRKIPNARGTHKTDEYEIFESFNSKGIRGPEYFYSKRDEEYRILVLGDSHAEGYRVQFQDLFSEQMKQALTQKESGRYEVINAGTSGYCTDQELLFFQNEGKKYQPNLTILMLSPNNIWYNNQAMMSYWSKPRFLLKEGELQLVPVPSSQLEEPFIFTVKQWIKKQTYLGQFLHEKITHSPFYAGLSQWGLTPFQDHLRVWQRKDNPEVRDSWQLTGALLLKMKQEVESSGSQFLIFYVPLPSSVYPEAWEEKKRKYRMSEAEWDPLQDSKVLEAFCAKHGIDLLNPVDRFKTAAAQLEASGKKMYSFRDEHWTVSGHQLAGKILSEHLSEKYLRKQGS